MHFAVVREILPYTLLKALGLCLGSESFSDRGKAFLQVSIWIIYCISKSPPQRRISAVARTESLLRVSLTVHWEQLLQCMRKLWSTRSFKTDWKKIRTQRKNLYAPSPPREP